MFNYRKHCKAINMKQSKYLFNFNRMKTRAWLTLLDPTINTERCKPKR